MIDNIVFDCTEFQHEHPGGASVIQNFIGQDFTWQFWRFHSLRQMEEKWEEDACWKDEGG
ncbi:hypothetical protein DPV78_001355 [Talaromyces pinophilus]|jgi:cytochrome b involved in lipid metabolism|nr:hypothetical protein DPV78_001355 [Talaromyces pinophilus]